MTTAANILMTIDGHVATVTINRPQQLNALNEPTLTELKRSFDELGQNREVRAIILTGSGEKAFVAGADITAMSQMTPDQASIFARLGHETMSSIETCARPVIAAVNGFCLGGGFELALACDFIYVADSAKLGLPEVGLGLFPGWGGTQRLTRLLGKNKAKEVIYSARIFTAPEALAMGIVNKVCPRESLLAEVAGVAREIASKGPIAVGITKLLINGACNTTLNEGLAAERNSFAECFRTEDLKEGLKAFVEKRKPIFQGK
ncbi:MAG: enoyl-CoA hydratase/isomerase family protein [Deltaproteobacteria bacterium]|nr:enoyl-CoA hydratase/isomerase family protein [Deltaproteobacteria bacterium]